MKRYSTFFFRLDSIQMIFSGVNIHHTDDLLTYLIGRAYCFVTLIVHVCGCSDKESLSNRCGRITLTLS